MPLNVFQLSYSIFCHCLLRVWADRSPVPSPGIHKPQGICCLPASFLPAASGLTVFTTCPVLVLRFPSASRDLPIPFNCRVSSLINVIASLLTQHFMFNLPYHTHTHTHTHNLEEHVYTIKYVNISVFTYL